MGSFAASPYRIHPVSIPDHEFPRRRLVENACAHSRIPMSWLLKAGQIIHRRGGSQDVEIPFLFAIKWHKVIGADQDESPGAQFLIIIARQIKWVFRHQRQERTEPIGAEPIRVHTGSSCEAKVKIVLEVRECVSEQSSSPEQMRVR